MGKIFKNRHVTSGIGDAGDKGLYRYKTIETKNKRKEVNTFADGTKERNVYKRSNDDRYKDILIKQNGEKVESPFTMESPFTKKKKCWKNYERTPGTVAGTKGSCRPKRRKKKKKKN